MRDLILRTDRYSDAEWFDIVAYCWEDVEVLRRLVARHPTSPRQFHRAR